ncbi:TRAFAC clade GTPase domain-containing protein [Pectobacterium punjabense]|uniref:TRAFAC clade GTPase domain-containing protein n=1 Tax=Pectobacterium punjabense TaxID=2108399 RepID=UPI003D9B1996
MSGSCRFEGCTVEETGVCALENSTSTCANRIPLEEVKSVPDDALGYADTDLSSIKQLGAPVLVQPTNTNTFGSGRTLGLDDISELMGARYVNVVGILGEPESGKTACLASLYLLVSHASLEGWSFADSRSLMAFEDIARGARDWNDGHVPEQMTVHTELADERNPGFLHLKLKRIADGQLVDLALPDIPGEWTQSLVTTARSDRLDFLKSAEVIWIVIDGRNLADLEKRQGQIARVGQLAGRLNTMLEGCIPRLLIVITHHDMHGIDDKVCTRLEKELSRRGNSAEIVCVAPFSDRPDEIPPGFGIASLIDKTADHKPDQPVFWPSNETADNARAYLSFRRDR